MYVCKYMQFVLAIWPKLTWWVSDFCETFNLNIILITDGCRMQVLQYMMALESVVLHFRARNFSIIWGKLHWWDTVTLDLPLLIPHKICLDVIDQDAIMFVEMKTILLISLYIFLWMMPQTFPWIEPPCLQCEQKDPVRGGEKMRSSA